MTKIQLKYKGMSIRGNYEIYEEYPVPVGVNAKQYTKKLYPNVVYVRGDQKESFLEHQVEVVQ